MRSKCINHVIYSVQQATEIIRIYDYIAQWSDMRDSMWLTCLVHWEKGASKNWIEPDMITQLCVNESQSIYSNSALTCFFLWRYKGNISSNPTLLVCMFVLNICIRGKHVFSFAANSEWNSFRYCIWRVRGNARCTRFAAGFQFWRDRFLTFMIRWLKWLLE